MALLGSHVLTRAEQPDHNCCLSTIKEKDEKLILSLLGLRKMEMWISLADSEIRNLFWDFQSTAKKMVHQTEESPGPAFFWTQEVKARSWIGRSQKVSASGVCHKCGQMMEENLPVNTSEWGTDTHWVMASIVLMTLKVKGKKEIKSDLTMCFIAASFSFKIFPRTVQIPVHICICLCIYIHIYVYRGIYIDIYIFSVQGEHLYQKGIIMHFSCKFSFIMQRDSSLFCSQEKSIPMLQKQWQMGFDKKTYSTLSSAIIEHFHLCSQTVLMVYHLSSEVISYILCLI